MGLECDIVVSQKNREPMRLGITRLNGSSDEVFAQNSLGLAQGLKEILGSAGVRGEVSVAIAENASLAVE